MTNDERLSAFNNILPVTSLQCFLNVFCPKDFIIIYLNEFRCGLRCELRWTQMWNCFNWMSLLRLENHSGEIRFCFKYHLMLIKFSPSNSHTYEKKVFWFDLINYSLLLFRFDHFYPFSRIQIENRHLYWITGENYHFDWIKSQSCHWQPFLLPPSNKFSFTS